MVGERGMQQRLWKPRKRPSLQTRAHDWHWPRPLFMPLLPHIPGHQDKLKELGGDYVVGPDWHPLAGVSFICLHTAAA